MPPNLDIYGLTKLRKKETIESFLDEHVDRIAGEDRGEEELSMIPLGTTEEDLRTAEDYEWEPAISLSHVVERGLDYPRRAFRVYLPSRQADIDGVVLGFTEDDQLVLGLSIDDAGMKPENEARARSLLVDLAKEYDCHLGLITCERPPGLSTSAFLAESENSMTVYFTTLSQ
jgi:hypothetical protein